MESAQGTSETDVCPYKLWDNQVVFNGKWIQTRQVRFKTADGTEGLWQSVHRNTKPEGAPADGVSIVAKLTKAGVNYIVLVKQFRIPTGKMCIELPAGLIDKNENAEQAAIRELKEETGYTCQRVLSESVECFLDPGLTDDSQCFVICEIDGDAQENLNPKQHLDTTESIEVVLVEHRNLLKYLKSLDKSIAVESSLYAYAFGAHFSTIFGNK